MRIPAFPPRCQGAEQQSAPRGHCVWARPEIAGPGGSSTTATRHASDRANSRPLLAPRQQPPPATSSLPPLLPGPPRWAPNSARASARGPLGPRGWRRGWDRTDVAHAWWRQARELRRRGQRRAGPPGPGSWGWRCQRWRRGLARPRGRRPTAAGGAVCRPGGEPPGGSACAGRAGPAERAAARGECPAEAREPEAEAGEPQPLPSGLAPPRRGRRRGARGDCKCDPGPWGGRHEQESERQRPGGRAGQPQGPEGPPREAGGHVPPRTAAAAPRAAGAAPARGKGRAASARTWGSPAIPGRGVPRALAVARGRSRGEAGPLDGPRPAQAAPRRCGGLGQLCAPAFLPAPTVLGPLRLRAAKVERQGRRVLSSPHVSRLPALAPAGFHGEKPRNGGAGLKTARNGCQSAPPNAWTFLGVKRTCCVCLLCFGSLRDEHAFWVVWVFRTSLPKTSSHYLLCGRYFKYLFLKVGITWISYKVPPFYYKGNIYNLGTHVCPWL